MIWMLTGLSLIGIWLNIKKKRFCFVVWTISNTVWCVIDFKVGLPEQGWLFVVYTGLSIYGWFAWGKDE